MRARRALIAVLATMLLSVGLAPWQASAQQTDVANLQESSAPLPDLDAIDPVRFRMDEAITSFSKVTTRNGVDTMWVDYIRPNTDEPVPTILIASPYFNTLGRGWKGELKEPHMGPSNPFRPATAALGGGTTEVAFPEWYDEYFVPRGYAVALMDLRGTRNSSGCQTYGDRDEVYDAVDVIDWIADQPWSNGKVGMTGGSYDGTIAIGAAAEQPMSGRHPNALGAIIPIRAIDRWYDYHFFNGVQSSSHQATPALFTHALASADPHNSGTDDLLFPLRVAERRACMGSFGALAAAGYASPYQDARDPFWRERDFARSARGFRTATFIIHGLLDFNVKTNNAGQLWESLDDDLPKKMWLMWGDHVDPHVPTPEDAQAGNHVMPHPFQAKFVEMTHRWYLQFLKGVEAGALDTPAVEIQRPTGEWDTSENYPVAGGDQVLNLVADGSMTAGEADAGSVAFRDGPSGNAPTSVTFTSAPFEEATRISGQFGFDLDFAAQGRDATIAVQVRTLEAEGLPATISYGWLRGYYRETVRLRGLSTPTAGSFLEPGTRYSGTFPSLYTDVVMPAGSALQFVFSASSGGTVASNLGGNVTLFTGSDGSRIHVPVAPAD